MCFEGNYGGSQNTPRLFSDLGRPRINMVKVTFIYIYLSAGIANLNFFERNILVVGKLVFRLKNNNPIKKGLKFDFIFI